MHHIISQHRCTKIGKPEWINNAGNIVELCKACHDETTASISWEMERAKEWRRTSHTRQNQIIEGGGDEPDRCWAMLKSGRRRCKKKGFQDNLCNDHYKSIKLGIPPHKSRHKKR